MVRKGGFEPPRLSAPPPQDGVSASSTTSALTLKPKALNYLNSIGVGRQIAALNSGKLGNFGGNPRLNRGWATHVVNHVGDLAVVAQSDRYHVMELDSRFPGHLDRPA